MAGTTGDPKRRSLDPRKTARALVPVTVVALVAAGAALAPALAAGNPSLPPITAEGLLAKVAQDQTTGFSGTVQYTLDLGLPEMPTLPGLSDSQLSLLTGTHTLHAAAASDGRERLGFYNGLAEIDVIRNKTDVWEWNSSTDTATHFVPAPGSGPADHGARTPKATPTDLPTTPQQAAQQVLQAVDPTTAVTVGGTENVAGRSAYTLHLAPKQAGSLIGEVVISVDSATGAPLRVRVFAAGATTPAFDVGFTDVAFTPPGDSTFDFTPPPGARVATQTVGQGTTPAPATPGDHPVSAGVIGSGWTSLVELQGVTLPAPPPSGSSDGNGPGNGGGDNSQAVINAVLGDTTRVSGPFGTGRLLSTHLVTILLTDDGRLYVGAVTPSELESEAASSGGVASSPAAHPQATTPVPGAPAPGTP